MRARLTCFVTCLAASVFISARAAPASASDSGGATATKPSGTEGRLRKVEEEVNLHRKEIDFAKRAEDRMGRYLTIIVAALAAAIVAIIATASIAINVGHRLADKRAEERVAHLEILFDKATADLQDQFDRTGATLSSQFAELRETFNAQSSQIVQTGFSGVEAVMQGVVACIHALEESRLEDVGTLRVALLGATLAFARLEVLQGDSSHVSTGANTLSRHGLPASDLPVLRAAAERPGLSRDALEAVHRAIRDLEKGARDP